MNGDIVNSSNLDSIIDRLQNANDTGSRVDVILAMARASRELRQLAATMLAPMRPEDFEEVLRWL